MITDQLIDKARAGEMAALVELDRAGLLIGADESCEQYADRLKSLQENIRGMDEKLDANGRFDVEQVIVEKQQRIPAELFDPPRATTEALYRFAIDWVPGFFVNPSFGWLFGGCAFYFYPDFFALFIIRQSFAARERWLIYSRNELLSHELCHIARIGLGSRVFEETFAYQTSTSGFRRVVGSIFRNPSDSFSILIATLVLLFAQILRVFMFPGLWIWPFWAGVGAVGAYLGARLFHFRLVFSQARRHAEAVAGDNALPLLFRCTDAEMLEIAHTPDPAALTAWMAERAEKSPRWQLIRERFLSGMDGGN